VACQCAWTFRLGHDSPLACGSWSIYQGGLPRHDMSRCRPTHGRADLALLQRGLRVLAITQRGKHDLRAGCRRREDRVESGVASGISRAEPMCVSDRSLSSPARMLCAEASACFIGPRRSSRFTLTTEFLVGHWHRSGQAASLPGSVKASRWSPKSAMISRRPPRAST